MTKLIEVACPKHPDIKAGLDLNTKTKCRKCGRIMKPVIIGAI